MKSLDLTGREFGKLKAIKDIGTDGKNHIWECICACGNTYYASAYLLQRGTVKSCGCLLDKSRIDNAEKAREGCKDFIKNGTNYKSIASKEALVTNKSTKERCITYDKQRKKYVVQMRYRGKLYFHKRYDTLEDAIIVRDELLKARMKDLQEIETE